MLLLQTPVKPSQPTSLHPCSLSDGINTWLGGLAIHQMLQTLTGGTLGGASIVSWLGITAAQAWCFAAFWAMQVRLAGGWPSLHR